MSGSGPTLFAWWVRSRRPACAYCRRERGWKPQDEIGCCDGSTSMPMAPESTALPHAPDEVVAVPRPRVVKRGRLQRRLYKAALASIEAARREHAKAAEQAAEQTAAKEQRTMLKNGEFGFNGTVRRAGGGNWTARIDVGMQGVDQAAEEVARDGRPCFEATASNPHTAAARALEKAVRRLRDVKKQAKVAARIDDNVRRHEAIIAAHGG